MAMTPAPIPQPDDMVTHKFGITTAQALGWIDVTEEGRALQG